MILTIVALIAIAIVGLLIYKIRIQNIETDRLITQNEQAGLFLNRKNDEIISLKFRVESYIKEKNNTDPFLNWLASVAVTDQMASTNGVIIVIKGSRYYGLQSVYDYWKANIALKKPTYNKEPVKPASSKPRRYYKTKSEDKPVSKDITEMPTSQEDDYIRTLPFEDTTTDYSSPETASFSLGGGESGGGGSSGSWDSDSSDSTNSSSID